MNLRSRARLSLLIGALVAAAAVATLGGLAFFRKVQSFQPLGFDVRSVSGPSQTAQRAHWQVTRVEQPSRLHPGDAILLVNGESPRTLNELRRALGRQPTNELLVARGKRLQQVSYPRRELDLDFPYLVLALIGVGYLLIGAYTLLRDPRSEARLFFLWCLASATVYLFTLPAPSTELDAAAKVIFLVEELARLLLPPLTLHLFLVFPRPLAARPTWSAWKSVVAFLYLPAAVLAALQADLVFADGRYLTGPPNAFTLLLLDRIELYAIVLYGLLAVAVLAHRLRRHRDWEQQRQVQWVAIGLAGGYLPFLLLYVAPLTLRLPRPELLTTLAVLPLALVPLAFAYAILRYKLWDIGVIVRQTLALTLTLLLGVLGFSLIHLLISRGIPEQFAAARNLLSFLAGLVIAGLLVPTRQSLSGALERLQYRGTFGKRRALSLFGKELLHERELGPLAENLLRHLEEGLALERANLYLVQRDALLPARAERGLPVELALDALGPELWENEVRGLSGVALPTVDAPPAQQLFLLGYRYAFPLAIRGNRVGVVLTGYKRDQTPLNTEDVDLIRGLLDQAALAIENAQLLAQLHDQLQEVIRLQQRNEGIIESSPAGIAVLDARNHVVSANLAFAQLARAGGGPDEREETGGRDALRGRPLGELLPVRPLPSTADGLVEVSFCDQRGRERHLQMSMAELPGKELRILVVQDVSERVGMENALKEKDRLAALGMLAAGVAHEVNTPITGISSYAQMLIAETDQSDPRYSLLKKVERQTFRAASIVSNLLEFARDRPQQRQALDVLHSLRESVELFKERFTEHNIELEWKVPGGPLLVVGNDGELQQVFTNLLVNAIDALAQKPPAERGGDRITLEAAARDGWVSIAVADTGPGIPQEKLEMIFQPFFSTKLARGGTGLGLSISFSIVRRHGGTLRAESTPGAGSRFVVELPRHQAAAEPHASGA